MLGLKISPATILDIALRASDAVQSECDAILNKIRGASILYVDETSIHVQGERHGIWTFSTPSESFFVIRKSHGMKVLTEVLTRRLRESKDIAEKFGEAIPLHNVLKELYEMLTEALEKVRKTLWQLAREAPRQWTLKEYSTEKV